MRGPCQLKPSQINVRVPANIRGVYCLAKEPDRVLYVGRADRNLRQDLMQKERRYSLFWYDTALSPAEAFRIQCREYHKHIGNEWLENRLHPVPPHGCEAKCPECGRWTKPGGLAQNQYTAGRQPPGILSCHAVQPGRHAPDVILSRSQVQDPPA